MKKQITLLVFFLLASVGTAFAQCNSCSLNGSSFMSIGQTQTFSTSFSSGYSYFWSVTGGLSISGSNTGTSVSVTAVSGTSGTVHVVRYRAGGAPCSASKSITITPAGCNFSSVTVTRVSGNCNSGVFVFRANPNVSGIPISYNWTPTLGRGRILSGQGTNQVTILATPNTTVGVQVDVTACNVSKTAYGGYLCQQIDPCGGFIICPEIPNSGSLEQGEDIVVALNRKDTELSERIDKTVTVEVIDQFGKTLTTTATAGDELRVPTAGLKSGIYILNITSASGEKHTKRVAIK